MKRLNYFELVGITIAAIVVASFCRWKYNSDWFEVSGFITGVIAVYLTAKEHITSWPVGIVNVLIYAYVFYVAKLYADTTLQFMFLGLSIHGWLSWARGGEQSTELKISRLKPIHWGYVLAILAVGTAVYKPIIEHFKGASPFWDSLLMVASVTAQVLLNRKILETWVLWILIDIAYIPLYLSRQLYPTTILYVIFLALAIGGLVQWIKNYQKLGDHVLEVSPDLSNYPR